MDEQRQREAIEALTTKGVKQPCPRCGNDRFEVVGEAMIALSEEPGTVVVGGPAVPVILVACSNCGLLTHHAQGPLGLIRRA